ncbi:WYL domain-containing protein [Myroides sp. M-43]|uniref:helix-turn-helix transcriptional regulator n=1 Tax=Myroides oncorhynchi TaxID=2893756 RepID=UPI001E606766|nr:WYL domain-containing protein [Myroides oncorhynchi]MCC9043275.1 WYL domain-containing protein [Myroides oncorhynchi]
MKKLRYYFLVLNYLNQNHYPSREKLLEYLASYDIDISERTLYRALSDLSTEFGVEVSLDNTKKGYYIAPKYLATANQVLLQLKDLVTTDILNAHNGSKSGGSIFIDAESKKGVIPIDVVRLIYTAMTKSQKISFTYTNHLKGSSSHLKIAPILFKQFEDTWYVVAIEADNSYTTYFLDTISDVRIENEKFKACSESARDKFSEIIGLNFTGRDLNEVVLSFDKHQKNLLQASPLHSSQVIGDDLTNDRLIVTLMVKPNFELKQQIMKFGKLVKVISPVDLKEDIIKELRFALEQHEEEYIKLH